MLFPATTLEAVERGDVTLAFRRWTRPRVRPGTRLRTLIGLVEITSVGVVQPEEIDPEDARRAGFESRDSLLTFLAGRPGGDIYRIGIRHAGPDPRNRLREQDQLEPAELAGVVAALRRMDDQAQRGPWVLPVLRAILRRPAVRAPDLAVELGWPTDTFKRQVRRLKELGLTESLGTGYRISPRGRVVPAAYDLASRSAEGLS
ncbi:hypothetical protein AB0873_26755 [Micromonospora sp. NPDC047707]|uniref:hypothetical protein n=1 Tax=Micromonospora sp. NPDC047707 TaxID=3154498 RepID=UPI003455F3EC